VDFLLSRDPDFRWQPAAGSIRHVDYYQRAVERLRDFTPRHVEPDSVFSSTDLPQGKPEPSLH
jgi:hypothetical protein